MSGIKLLEVALGYTEQMAVEEAQRCLNCKTNLAWKVVRNVKFLEFISLIAQGKFEEAIIKLRNQQSSAICGRVCPQETQWSNVACGVLRVNRSL